MARDFQAPGRSAVYATRGMVACSHPLAAAAALAVLQGGGNAVDAAITASAVLTLAEPHMTSAGGDCFAIVALPDGSRYGLNGSGRSAAALTPDYVRAQGLSEIHEDHGTSVTAPGAVAAWSQLLERFGSIGLDRALAPAIDLAESGVPVAPRVARDWAGEVGRLVRDPGGRRHYLTAAGDAPAVGDVVRFPALARTYRRIAEAGRDGFYTGAVAEDICAAVARRGGCLTPDDLAATEATWVDPMLSPYRGLSVGELPPNGQGITALILIGILERLGLAGLDPLGAQRLHLEIEAARLAYACRDRFVSDPATADLPAAALIEPAFLDRLAARIDPRRRMVETGPIDPREKTDTVYLCIVDADGMAVSFINSVFDYFGSAIVAPDSGVVLQNRGSGFVLTPGHPNEVGPRKRPLHTLIPGLLVENGLTRGVFGVMGGQYQACGHAHLVSNLIDYGMDPQAAIDLPRAFFEGDATVLETGVAEATAAELVALGHQVRRADSPLGGGQAILIDRRRGVLIAGSDPRKDGCAIGL